MRCANCAEEIRPVRDGDGIDESDRDQFSWVDLAGNPVCATLFHEPAAPFSWRDMFAKYAGIVEACEGVTFLYRPGTATPGAEEWTPEEWAAISSLPGWK